VLWSVAPSAGRWWWTSSTVPPAGEGAIVAAVDCGGVCGTDLHLQRGHLDVPTPLLLGHEGLGTVHELGRGVDRDANGAALRPGDRVMLGLVDRLRGPRPVPVARGSDAM
jgi:D-arabinose 1-dehydrogenase-like Zn-dependent alcohol dehydrogenase